VEGHWDGETERQEAIALAVGVAARALEGDAPKPAAAGGPP